jgi:hypothetical protein
LGKTCFRLSREPSLWNQGVVGSKPVWRVTFLQKGPAETQAFSLQGGRAEG